MGFLNLIGNTPLVEVRGFDTGLCRLFIKLESQNPGGSIKDRVAVSMVDDAVARAELKPNGTIVEATAGNTGLGLALIGAQLGFRVLLVVPDKMSREKINHIKALGAEIVLTRSDVEKGHPDYYQDLALALSKKEPNAWFANQFANPANPLAHERTTGPEILRQRAGEVDAVVVGVGSGGTLGGLTACFRKEAPQIEMIVADPEGSVISPFIQTGRVPSECGAWVVEGIGEDFIPKNADFSMVKGSYAISDSESLTAARTLLRTNGILAGSSSGTLLAASLRYCREQARPKNVVTFVCDGGAKYLSKMFSDFWMVENGFLPRERFGDLRDLVSRHYSQGNVVWVSPSDRLKAAYARMKTYDISQLPVMEHGKVVGILDESDLLFALHASSGTLGKPVREVMTTKLKFVDPRESVERVIGLLKNGLVALVADKERFYGIITKMDVVDYFRVN